MQLLSEWVGKPDLERTYLFSARMLPFEILVDQPFVQRDHKCVVFDVRRKVKMSVRRLDMPLLLEMGSSFPVV
jgi:hypothetical protein